LELLVMNDRDDILTDSHVFNDVLAAKTAQIKPLDLTGRVGSDKGCIDTGSIVGCSVIWYVTASSRRA